MVLIGHEDIYTVKCQCHWSVYRIDDLYCHLYLNASLVHTTLCISNICCITWQCSLQ